jgi:ketosteroid isomerase-like protein
LKADSKTEIEVMAFMNRFNRAYRTRKIDDLMALFAPDPDVVLIGTGLDGRLVGRDKIRARAERDWAQSEASSFEYGWTSVSKIGSVALVSAEVTARANIAGKENVFPWRFTAALDNRAGKWLVCQLHLSAPASGQTEGKSWPTKQD